MLKEKYPEAIIGKQRKNSISSLKQNLEKDVKVRDIKYDKIYDNQIISRESDSLYDLNWKEQKTQISRLTLQFTTVTLSLWQVFKHFLSPMRH